MLKRHPRTYFIDAHFDCLDMQLLQEETVKLLIENSHGQVDANSPRLECNRGRVTGIFRKLSDAQTAVKVLMELGIEAKMYRDDLVEPFVAARLDDLYKHADPRNHLLIRFAGDQTWLRREIVRLLTDDLVCGWQHCGPGCFLVLCHSASAAMSLYEKVGSSPVGNEANCDFIEDFGKLFA